MTSAAESARSGKVTKADSRAIVVGFFGLDRPSVQWHLTLKWHRLRHRFAGAKP